MHRVMSRYRTSIPCWSSLEAKHHFASGFQFDQPLPKISGYPNLSVKLEYSVTSDPILDTDYQTSITWKNHLRPWTSLPNLDATLSWAFPRKWEFISNSSCLAQVTKGEHPTYLITLVFQYLNFLLICPQHKFPCCFLHCDSLLKEKYRGRMLRLWKW